MDKCHNLYNLTWIDDKTTLSINNAACYSVKAVYLIS